VERVGSASSAIRLHTPSAGRRLITLRLHHVYTREAVQIVVPKSGSDSVKAIYVRRVMDALERLQLEEGDDDEAEG